MTSSYPPPTGAAKLSHDFAKLVNNRQGSDIRFLVGGGDTAAVPKSTDDSSQKTSEVVTMYGHSVILRCRSRYFDAMYQDGREWNETSSGVLRKPNISPVVFHSLLYFIYTGTVQAVSTSCLLELIAAAEEMEIEELSVECQTRVINLLNNAIIEEESNGHKKSCRPMRTDGSQDQLPFNVAVRKLLVPALILAYHHTLPIFFQNLLDFTIGHIEIILSSTDTLSSFLDSIPAQIFKQLLASNLLDLSEFDIWELAFKWACQQTKVLKSAVESQLRLSVAAGDDEDVLIDDDCPSEYSCDYQSGGTLEQTLVSDKQLQAFKSVLSPLIPAIRFTFIEPEQYASIADILTFLLPTRRYLELQRFFSQPGRNGSLDVPRKGGETHGTHGSKVASSESWTLLRKWICEINGVWCNTPSDLRFKLIYRASVHGFEAKAFHKRCDYKGSTVVLVRSTDGYVFGGVNFAQWTSQNETFQSKTNFLFTLSNSRCRREPTVFKFNTNSFFAGFNGTDRGPSFCDSTGNDLLIANMSNVKWSTSTMPHAYVGPGASDTTLAGSKQFLVEDYEVFTISRK